MNATIRKYSIGYLSGKWNRHPSEIRRAADRLGIAPAEIENDIEKFYDNQAEVIHHHLNEKETRNDAR